MNTQKKFIFGLVVLFICTTVLLSGCTQQTPSKNKNDNTTSKFPQSGDNSTTNTSINATLQTILAKAQTIGSMYYELTMTSSVLGETQTTTTKVWQKNSYVKEEITSTFASIQSTLTLIKRPEGLYKFNTATNSYELVSNMVLPQGSSGDMAHDILTNPTVSIHGTEVLDGKDTTIIQYTTTVSNYTMTVENWIWNEHGVPLKTSMETSGFPHITMNYVYSNYLFSEISDSTFSVS
jgi:hypothetical protein